MPFEDTFSYETLSYNRLVGFHFYSINRLIFGICLLVKWQISITVEEEEDEEIYDFIYTKHKLGKSFYIKREDI